MSSPPPLPGQARPSGPRGVIGIDLGTSNSVAAFQLADEDGAPSGGIVLCPVPQTIDAGVVEARPQLPSFLYIPAAGELGEGALALPWEANPRFCVGAFAREHGAKVPHRVVHSAKSWLCHDGVDRRGPILPAGRAEDGDVARLSPLAASAHYLAHLKSALALAGHKTADHDVVLTVPASFDPAARDLTVEAARAAGIANPLLLEEPTAALYAWLEGQGEAWRKQLQVGETVLVVDIGGGTTDFSLIRVTEDGGSLGLERVAVGDHILLGGDNMDFALAFAVRKQLEGEGTTLDNWQLRALVQSARAAKEALLENADRDAYPIVIPSRGSRLFAKSITAQLTRGQVIRIVCEGFFPFGPIGQGPRAARRAGLTQLGLPYASDPSITRHLAAFLARQGGGEGGFAHPTAVLFNGGVLQSDIIRQRVTTALNQWLEADGAVPIKVLSGASLDVAVARGAVYCGHARRGQGVRIRGGTARTYYVGVEEPMPAVPGFEPPLNAICVAPFGMEEGTSYTLSAQRFGLVIGEPVRFRFFASTTRKDDPVGTVLTEWSDDVVMEIAPIETALEDGEAQPGEVVEVQLVSSVTTTGTLVLEAVGVNNDERRWTLEFRVRGEE